MICIVSAEAVGESGCAGHLHGILFPQHETLSQPTHFLRRLLTQFCPSPTAALPAPAVADWSDSGLRMPLPHAAAPPKLAASRVLCAPSTAVLWLFHCCKRLHVTAHSSIGLGCFSCFFKVENDGVLKPKIVVFPYVTARQSKLGGVFVCVLAAAELFRDLLENQFSTPGLRGHERGNKQTPIGNWGLQWSTFIGTKGL